MKPQATLVILRGRTILVASMVLVHPAMTQAPSSEHLWDVIHGITVTDHSPLLGAPFTFDVYSMFGSTLAGGTEPNSVNFADGGP